MTNARGVASVKRLSGCLWGAGIVAAVVAAVSVISAYTEGAGRTCATSALLLAVALGVAAKLYGDRQS